MNADLPFPGVACPGMSLAKRPARADGLIDARQEIRRAAARGV